MNITKQGIKDAFKGLDKILEEIENVIEDHKTKETLDDPRQTYIDFEEPMYMNPEEELDALTKKYGTEIPTDTMSDGLAAYLNISEDDEEYYEEPAPEDEPYCINCHNIKMIDEIINNTLKRSEPVKPHTAHTLKTLAELKALIVDIG